MAEPALQVRDAVCVKGGRRILDGVSFLLSSHSASAIIGPSGAGKSTFLRCLARLDNLESGEVRCAGLSQQSIPAHEWRRNVGFVSQRFSLFGHLTALENIELGLRRARGLDRREAAEHASKWLDRVGLCDLGNRRPHQLSGGQAQRVAIARAAALEPQVLLLDEVTSALDPELVGEVEDVVVDLARGGMSIVLVTHEISFAATVASEIMVMDQGQVVESGTYEQLLCSNNQRVTRFLSRHLRNSTPPVDSEPSANPPS